ncbi:nuclear transport factor 2 family protein [Gammaproteobacteria bacterium]|nr:nuclear transport factor 2 family protein [Gammaproteobacteria bacterium]
MKDYKKLTYDYIKAFNEKNLESCSKLFSDNFILEDPVVNSVAGKNKALDVIKNIFDVYDTLSFKSKNIYQDDTITIIEFILVLDKKIIEGVDVIEWHDGKMLTLRAYFNV